MFTLTSTARQAMDRLAGDFRRVLDDRFVALVAYGPTRAAAFATSLTSSDLQALSTLADGWHRDGLDTPLMMTPDEFRRSLDAFPLEYEAMLDRHILVAGTPPFGSDRPSEADLRRACEVQAQAFLIHLRQGWLHSADHHDEHAEVLVQSAAPLRALLANVARLHGSPGSDDDGLIQFAEQAMGLPARVLSRVLSLEHQPQTAATLVNESDFLTAYLLTAETLWAFVDQWRR